MSTGAVMSADADAPQDRPFRRVLIANRGEIAVRIARTLRSLGIEVATVHSDADRDAMHVRAADVSVPIGPSAAASSYLRADAVVAAAVAVGAEAIHPGYGFLSERVELAERCAAAGIVFVGPPPSAVLTMGDKIRARRAVAAAGVPVVPGVDEPGLDDDALADAATAIGFPVLVKPSAGGGGKGMRVAASPSELRDALVSARREAAGAFGDDTLFLERYVSRPRHLEVQVLCDAHGGAVHLGERECSLQRRHQKIVEEAPSPIVDADRRARLGVIALDAARAVGYVNAGTVEMIVSADAPDEVFFLEMNTRLQVEHPVTEAVWGVDLVAEQLWIAAGRPLRLEQDRLRPMGHAIEARVYAEDPSTGFLPSPGPIHVFRVPGRPDPNSGTSVRVDAGVADGDRVSPHYDPMIAKVIVHGPDRAAALDGLDRLLADTRVAGVTTNVGFLRRLLADPAVRSGDLDTGLVDRGLERFAGRGPDDAAVIAAALAVEELRRANADPGDPWALPGGWRLGESAWSPWRARVGDREVVVRTRGDGDEREAMLDDGPSTSVAARLVGPPRRPTGPGDVGDAVSAAVDVRVGNDRRRVHVTRFGVELWLSHGGDSWCFTEVGIDAGVHRSAAEASGTLHSPMPGTVVAVEVAEGDEVAEGRPVVSVEAMKMEHTLRAPFRGRVTDVFVSVGDRVPLGADLVHLDPIEDVDDEPVGADDPAPDDQEEGS